MTSPQPPPAADKYLKCRYLATVDLLDRVRALRAAMIPFPSTPPSHFSSGHLPPPIHAHHLELHFVLAFLVLLIPFNLDTTHHNGPTLPPTPIGVLTLGVLRYADFVAGAARWTWW